MKKILHYSLLIILIALLYNCRPERVYIEDQDAMLSFTVDTVYFDTIFTTLGTSTKSFRVFNPHDRFIKIDEVDLAGGSNSVFRINVDGAPGTNFNGLEIAPHDSMYIFVEATLNPNNSPDILRIQDSITFSVNGNFQDVDLVAWGQDVHILRDSILDYSTTWVADKPYLIVGAILVDTLQTLTMEEGVQVYMHRDSWIYVLGSLKMLGTLEEPIQIQGDRLELLYEDIPGQWGGILYANGSHSNVMDYTNIFNGTIGIWINSYVETTEPKLEISNSEINRMSHDGILAAESSIVANNLVIGDCGNSCLELLASGSYSFTHCTFANYWLSGYSIRKSPTLYMNNYYVEIDSNNVIHFDPRDMGLISFRNCIIYGDHSHEIEIDKHPDGQFDYSFDHCLTKIDRDEYDFLTDGNFRNIINGEAPLFDSLRVSYELDTLSPAIDMALPEYSNLVPFDKKGDSRFLDQKPDLGAYERIEQ